MSPLSQLDLLNLHAPFEVMKFTLVYDGDLPASGNSSRKTQEKWDIRKKLHPQIRELCQTHKVLKEIYGDRPTNFNVRFAPIPVRGILFRPLVHAASHLVCGLKILFLRKEEPGAIVLQGGDIDGRIKTLLDALRMPSDQQFRKDNDIPNPMFCLLQDDTLVTELSVKTDRLLSGNTRSIHEVRLVIEVDVRVTNLDTGNIMFAGD